MVVLQKDIKINNKKFFKYIGSRKLAREAVGPLDAVFSLS